MHWHSATTARNCQQYHALALALLFLRPRKQPMPPPEEPIVHGSLEEGSYRKSEQWSPLEGHPQVLASNSTQFALHLSRGAGAHTSPPRRNTRPGYGSGMCGARQQTLVRCRRPPPLAHTASAARQGGRRAHWHKDSKPHVRLRRPSTAACASASRRRTRRRRRAPPRCASAGCTWRCGPSGTARPS